jgi:D-alanyl-D-alanine carboxypeptidase
MTEVMPRTRRTSSRVRRRRAIAVGAVLVTVGATVFAITRPVEPPVPEIPTGTPSWAAEHYGNPDSPGFKNRNIVTLEFLGRTMFVHRKAMRHFLRLERLFEARAPDYALGVAYGTLDDWSYDNRGQRGAEGAKSNHAFGLAVDINALTNVQGTPGDMPLDVVLQWELEGGDWGGDWTNPDPMHFETHLTPEEIRARYRKDGTPKDWYLAELIGG